MKVEIIRSYNFECLQDEVNDWLKSFKGHIVNMSMGTFDGSLITNFYMAILYEE